MPRRSYELETTPRDTVLLLHGMMLMSDFSDDEMSPVFDAYVETIPELRQADIGALREEVARLRLERPKSEWAAALGEITSEVVKQKTLILALDIAMGSGGMVTPGEDELLEEVRNALGLDLAFAEKTLDILSIKYAT